MFYDNYVRLCNSIGKTPSAVAIEIGVSKSIVSRWKNGGGATDAVIQRVADYFGVTVEVLTAEQKNKPAAPEGSELTEMQQKAVDMILNMSEEQLKAFTAAAEAFLT